jgi:hypothetical protein
MAALAALGADCRTHRPSIVARAAGRFTRCAGYGRRLALTDADSASSGHLSAAARAQARPSLQVVRPAALFHTSTNLRANQAFAAGKDSLRLAADTLREGTRSELLRLPSRE